MKECVHAWCRVVWSAVVRAVVQTWQSELVLGKWRNKKAFEGGTSFHAGQGGSALSRKAKSKLVPIQPQWTSRCLGRMRFSDLRASSNFSHGWSALSFRVPLSPIPSTFRMIGYAWLLLTMETSP